MAFIKYKELTRYFNFKKEINAKELPNYVTDYLYSSEKVLAAYTTSRDKGIFTDRRILLFDNNILHFRKEIHTIPVTSISACSIIFKKTSADLFIYLDSGYPFRLRFINLGRDEKTKLRVLYKNLLESKN